MTMKPQLRVFAILSGAVSALLSIVLLAIDARAQSATSNTTRDPATVTSYVNQEIPYVESGGQSAPAQSYRTVVTQRVENPRANSLRQLDHLRKKLKEAAATEQRQEVIDEVEAALSAYFDQDMELRRAELDRLNKRTDDTQAQNDKRLSARSELIQLQLQSFMHDAQGLGLFDDAQAQAARLGYLRVPVTIAKLSGAETVRFAIQEQQVSSTKQLRDDRKASMDRIAEARGKLAGVEDPESERKALEELQQALGQYFDKDMEIRRAELERVRNGLNDMEARLQKRAAAKEGIVQLQLKMIVNEADGLGFFSDGDTSRVYGGGSMFAPSGAMNAPGASPMNPFFPAATPRPDRGGAPRPAR